MRRLFFDIYWVGNFINLVCLFILAGELGGVCTENHECSGSNQECKMARCTCVPGFHAESGKCQPDEGR